MGAENSIDALIPLVTQMSGQIVTMTGRFGTLQSELAAVRAVGEATLAQATKTNGRVTAHDGEISLLHQAIGLISQDEARDERDATIAESRRQMRATAMVAIIAAIVGAAVVEIGQLVLHVTHLG